MTSGLDQCAQFKARGVDSVSAAEQDQKID